jgi:hypothetical protein
MTTRSDSRGDPVEAGALALQRVLALEGRNALARVELAASELVGLEASPAVRDRLAVIREGVDLLDGVLDKIERLADPRREDATTARTPLASVWTPLVERIAPALRARGIGIEATGAWREQRVAVPAAVLERFLLAFVRIAIAALGAGDPEEAGRPTVLSIECREEGDAVELFVGVVDARGERRFEVDRGERVELEVALAEWRGELIDATAAFPSRIGLRLRRISSDA